MGVDWPKRQYCQCSCFSVTTNAEKYQLSDYLFYNMATDNGIFCVAENHYFSGLTFQNILKRHKYG